MPPASYSFIDVAVMDGVRERFAAGDAVVILSVDLDELIWANGPGALLFGHADVEGIGGAESGLSYAAKRQIMATSGFPQIGRDRSVVVRQSRGIDNRVLVFLASEITLPDGEEAIMLVEPAIEIPGHEAEVAEAAIGGFTEPGHLVAFLDGQGKIEAASANFLALGISARTLAELAAEAARAGKRLVKKRVPTRSGSVPAGIARLRDEPARCLMVAIDETLAAAAVVTGPRDEPDGEPAADHEMPEQGEFLLPELTLQKLAEFGSEAFNAPNVEPEAATTIEASAGDSDIGVFSADLGRADPLPPPVEEGFDTAPKAKTLLVEDLSEAVVVRPKVADTPASIAPTADQAAAPLRFVWRTDEKGRISGISPEFLRAIGAEAADIVGEPFKTLSEKLKLDPFGEISGLLERRDTWSGRSVLWPIAGTDLKAPVDLAALPVYSRDRTFEGFRGFGVARMADAIVEADVPAFGAAEPDLFEEADADGGEAFSEANAEPDFAAPPPAPQRRQTDKVIRLEERRAPPPDMALSTHEKSAFREIGEKLRGSDGGTLPPAIEPSAEVEPDVVPNEHLEIDAIEQADEAVIAEEATFASELGASPTTSDPAASLPVEDVAVVPQKMPAAERSPERVPHPGQAEAASPVQSGREEISAEAPTAPSREPLQSRPSSAELKIDGFLPSAFSGPSSQPRKPIQDTGILSRLPVPLLIHAGDVLHYANEAFLGLTAYESLEQLAEAGGLGVLFSESYDDDQVEEDADRAIRLKTRDGLEFPIEALLRSVPWNGGNALMLVVRRTGDEEEFLAEPLRADTMPAAEPELAEPRAVEMRSEPMPVAAPPPPVFDPSGLSDRVAEMRTIIDTATDGVILIANDGTIRSISRPAEALFGFATEELADKPFISLFAMESQRTARDYLAGLAENGVASVMNDGREVIGRESQGRFIPLFMTIGRLPSDSGYCAVVRDITQWKRAEEELTQAKAVAERASSQKTDFLARVSHEIRTPLNAIIGFSELMVDERFGPIANDRYRDYLRDINRSGNHVLDLVNDLLDITKIEAGEQEMDYEAVSLNDTLGETVAMMQPQANRERVIIRSSFASRLPEVVADQRSVRQIALNILSNAVRYTQAGGQVIVSTSYEPSGDVIMRVRDTGIGMSQAEIELALKPFKQINAVKRRRGDGTGLGLPLTKAMVEANRARFAINSTPGEGTLVEVVFPSTRVLAD